MYFPIPKGINNGRYSNTIPSPHCNELPSPLRMCIYECASCCTCIYIHIRHHSPLTEYPRNISTYIYHKGKKNGRIYIGRCARRACIDPKSRFLKNFSKLFDAWSARFYVLYTRHKFKILIL